MSISGAMISTISAFRNPTDLEIEVREQAMTSNSKLTMGDSVSMAGNSVLTMGNSVRKNPLKVMVAEVGYILTIPFAVVEAALSLTAKIFSFPLPISAAKHSKISTWLTDSMFAVRYSIANAILNPFRFQLVEKNAYAPQYEEE